MPKNEFVVEQTFTGLYLVSYNVGNPPSSTFGNLSDAVIFSTLEQAEAAASAIGGGTVGTVKP